MTRMSEIPPELLAEMTPAVRVFVESLLMQMADMRGEIEDLKAQVKRLTPQELVLARHRRNIRDASAELREAEQQKSKKKRGGQKGHRRAVQELVPVERCSGRVCITPRKLSTLHKRRTRRQRSRSDSSSRSAGSAGDRTDHRRISAASTDLLWLRDDDAVPRCLPVCRPVNSELGCSPSADC